MGGGAGATAGHELDVPCMIIAAASRLEESPVHVHVISVCTAEQMADTWS